jgi:16S rRNA (uracil1498-N3)-methyltransferase
MQLFFEPDITDNGNILNLEESNHCIRVLRHKEGDVIQVINGKGSRFDCQITAANPKQCQLEIIDEQREKPSPINCHIAVAPTKNIERFEWFLEKGTEIGIQSITPIVCRFSERKVLKPERLDKIITSAIKQSMSLWRPVLNPIIGFNEFLNSSVQLIDYQKFIGHCHEDDKLLLKNAYQIGRNVVILIGPEGDFDKTELEKSFQAGYSPVSLGNKRLRTETAALAACHTIQLLND